MVVYICTKGGEIAYVSVEMKDALNYKRAFGCTIWTCRMEEYRRLSDHFLT